MTHETKLGFVPCITDTNPSCVKMLFSGFKQLKCNGISMGFKIQNSTILQSKFGNTGTRFQASKIT